MQSGPSRSVLIALLAAAVGTGSVLVWAQGGGNTQPVSAGTNVSSRLDLPKLPIVQQSTPAQPPVGLPADKHLDKTPPRRTTGLDLVKLGWSYNCMECHKLLTAKWHYDRPMVEHERIKLEHG